jgi:hypothetical protein
MDTLNRPVAWLWAACFLLAIVVASRQNGAAMRASQEVAGALRVKTDITGVHIFLDGEEKGTTPTTLRGLAPGQHQLALVKDGYEAQETAVTITAGATELVAVTMKPLVLPLPQLPAVFRAIHQHRLGTCIGTMTVTADAIDFVGDTKEDVFHIPIRTLRSVSHSFGRIPGMGGGMDGSSSLMACRFEAPDRAFGFWAVEKDGNDTVEVMSVKTRELLQVLYRLWTDTLKQPGKI